MPLQLQLGVDTRSNVIVRMLHRGLIEPYEQ